ncbi:hypothetical protein [Jongsikchunia kroppenstedtii]|uniref:hypothetical protein n=1 Tax=Jongsikchunia kroppenstedtii TaxID=1121721 RepID=UPI0003681A9D|nr:hypothetical protein [Jongsikchunia kroppenstedtii]
MSQAPSIDTARLGDDLSPGAIVDPVLLSTIRRRLASQGMPVGPAIVLFDLVADALHVAAVDMTTGQVLAHVRDGAVSTAALDRNIADHLVAGGVAERPTTRAWARELVGLMATVRARLVEHTSTFVMGSEHVGFIQIDRGVVDAALLPFVARAERLGNRAAVACTLEVTAAVLTSQQSWWPGLTAGLTAAYGVPVIAVGQPVAVVAGYRHEQPDVGVTSVVAPVTHAPRVSPTTREQDRLAMPLALAYSEVPGATGAVDVDTSVTDELDIPAIIENLDTDEFPPAMQPEPFDATALLNPEQRAARRRHNRNVLLGAAAAAAVLVGGAVAITSPSWSSDTPNRSTANEAAVGTQDQGPRPSVTPTPNVPIPSVAPDTAGATAPVVQFTPGPTKPPPNSVSGGVGGNGGGGNGPTRGHKPRLVLPNPIPGQPPIVVIP